MIIEYLKIKMEYRLHLGPADNWSTGRLYARIDNRESAQDIIDIIAEIKNTTNDLIYLGNIPCHPKPAWYKDNIQIRNKIYLGCWPNRIIQVDEDNNDLFDVEIIYDRKKI